MKKNIAITSIISIILMLIVCFFGIQGATQTDLSHYITWTDPLCYLYVVGIGALVFIARAAIKSETIGLSENQKLMRTACIGLFSAGGGIALSVSIVCSNFLPGCIYAIASALIIGFYTYKYYRLIIMYEALTIGINQSTNRSSYPYFQLGDTGINIIH